MSEPRPMRIAVDARYLAGGFSGIGEYSQRLLEGLSRIDRENQYEVFVHESFERKLDVRENFRLHRRASAPLSVDSLIGMGRAAAALKPDLFHAHCPVAPPWYGGPLIATVHDLQPLMMDAWTGGRPWPAPELYRAFYNWLYPRIFRRAAGLITVSKATRESLVERFPFAAEKTLAIPSGYAPDEICSGLSEAGDRLRRDHGLPERFVLYLGSTRPNKNIPRMIEAFARMLNDCNDLKDAVFALALTPDRFMEEVRKQIERCGIGANVRILPPVGGGEKAWLLANAKALFFVTRLEGFGFPILEAQGAGLPVLASTVDASPEVAGEGALLVDPDDVPGMANALARLLRDGELRERMAGLGRRNASRFTWDETAKRTLQAFRSILTGNQSS